MSTQRSLNRRALRLVGYRGSKANNKRNLSEATWIIKQFQAKAKQLATDPPSAVSASTD